VQVEKVNHVQSVMNRNTATRHTARSKTNCSPHRTSMIEIIFSKNNNIKTMSRYFRLKRPEKRLKLNFV